jgi:hypothetical protein
MRGRSYNFYHPTSLGNLEIYINQEFRSLSTNPGLLTKIENIKPGDTITIKSKGLFSSKVISNYKIRDIDLD